MALSGFKITGRAVSFDFKVPFYVVVVVGDPGVVETI